MADDYAQRDRETWEAIFANIPPEWYEAPPSDAMEQCRAYFSARPCARLLDLGCGFGRWAQFLAGRCAREIVGVDYATLGVRAASVWASRRAVKARFVVAMATKLPFPDRSFDGLLAALLLDNLSRTDSARAVEAFNSVVKPGARGFFVFNPVLTPAELEAVSDDNPTKGCMHVAYEDAELATLLSGWSVTRSATTAERFRIVEATFQG